VTTVSCSRRAGRALFSPVFSHSRYGQISLFPPRVSQQGFRWVRGPVFGGGGSVPDAPRSAPFFCALPPLLASAFFLVSLSFFSPPSGLFRSLSKESESFHWWFLLFSRDVCSFFFSWLCLIYGVWLIWVTVDFEMFLFFAPSERSWLGFFSCRWTVEPLYFPRSWFFVFFFSIAAAAFPLWVELPVVLLVRCFLRDLFIFFGGFWCDPWLSARPATARGWGVLLGRLPDVNL